MITYNVRAKRWARGWELHIDGLGVTQSRSLADAESMVRDYIAMDQNVDTDSFNVEITLEVGDGLDLAVREARDAVRDAEMMRSKAAAQSREVAWKLRAKGLSGRDVASVLAVSPQRVSQLLHDAPSS